jgi:aldehyde dehydrogenase (NAD+)
MMIQHKEKALKWLKGSPKRFLIGGQWVEGSGLKHFDVIDPSTEQVLGSLPEANSEIVRQAAQAARDAFKSKAAGSWSTKTRRERADALKAIGRLIREHADELAAIETLANGKTFKEARIDDLTESADVFDYYAGWTDKFYGESVPVDPPFMNYTVHEPVGVVGLIVPWNFPLLLGCWKLAPALAMGNTVVMKPASNTSHSMIRLFEIIHDAGILPHGVLNIVYGDGEPGSAVSSSPLIDKVSFTGSTVVGKKILAGSSASNLKSVTLELGGKSPNIIFGDAGNLDAVVDRCFTAMFCHKGEKCSEPTRFIVHSSIYDKFASKLVALAEAYKVGDPFAEDTQQGAQANRQHFEKILGYIEKGKKEGAKLLTGGTRVTSVNGGKGFFVRPTIFGDVKNSMAIAQEEIFGPVLCLIKFETEEEAVAIANDTQYGLAAGFYSSDASRCQRVARQLDAGMIFINHYGCYDFASPFGGFKQSGWGKEMAIHSLSAYTKTKSIWMKY